MAKKRSLSPFFFALTALLAVAVVAAFRLSLKEWKTPGACPSLGPVPACYLVFLGFSCALLGHLIHHRRIGKILFAIGLGFPTLLALFASIGELGGFLQCPKTAGGIAMCYLSLVLCVVSWVLWEFDKRATIDKGPTDQA